MSDEWRCILCGSPKGKKCRNTMARTDGANGITPDTPLPGREEHFARALRPTPIRENDE